MTLPESSFLVQKWAIPTFVVVGGKKLILAKVCWESTTEYV